MRLDLHRELRALGDGVVEEQEIHARAVNVHVDVVVDEVRESVQERARVAVEHVIVRERTPGTNAHLASLARHDERDGVHALGPVPGQKLLLHSLENAAERGSLVVIYQHANLVQRRPLQDFRALDLA